MSKSKKQRRLFASSLENLEPRVLLAGDLASAWQNPVMHNDVNQSGEVDLRDLFDVLYELRHNGPRELGERASAEPGSTSDAKMFDANGDNMLSPADLHSVLVEVREGAQGEGEFFRFRPEITDTAGDVVSSVGIGDEFQLSVYVQDLRGVSATGVFSAYVDVTYDSSLVSIPAGNTFTFGSEFGDAQSASAAVPGLLDEVGGLDQTQGTENFDAEKLLFQIDLIADQAGTVQFATDPVDLLPLHEFLEFDSLIPVPDTDIEFASVDLTIEADQTLPVDLVAFAQALDTAGVEFWSTRQLNTDAAAQRALFEDGQTFLPSQEALDSNGDLNAAATAAGVTQVNTWIFPDNTQATGVLTLEEISTRSGVAISRGSDPTLIEIAANGQVSVDQNEPLHLPLDAYDPENEAVTFTVTVDDPGLIEPTIVGGNRSWSLDVNGFGEMVFEFFEGRASRATDQFITLTEDDFYDDIIFHRVIDGFVIQGGDPLGTGFGGSDLPDFDDHFNVDLQHSSNGVLSMAKSSDDTNNSQFFVTDRATPELDFNHTVFGHLVEGYEVLEAISDVNVSGSTPIDDVVISEANVFTDSENGVLMLKALASSGTTNVTVTATDSQGNQTSETFQVDLGDAGNKFPFLADFNDELTGSPGETLQVQLAHTDLNNDDVVYRTSITDGSGATASTTTDGLVTINLPTDANNGDQISVLVSVEEADRVVNPADPLRGVDQQLVVVTIAEDIVAVDDTATVDEDSIDAPIDVLANDTLGGRTVTITSVGTPSEGGTVQIASDGLSLLYSPAANFPINSATAETEVVTYTITDTNSNATSTGSVVITVNPVNDPPVADDDAYPADFEFPRDVDEFRGLREDNLTEIFFPVMLNDTTLPDGELAMISAVDSATGTVRVATEFLSTRVAYIPGENVFGEDTFTYTITDTGGLSDVGTVTLNIAQVNDAPVAADDSVSAVAGRALQLAAVDLLGNDSAGPLEDSTQTITIQSITQPTNGSVVLNQDGSLTVTPSAGFEGTDTFTYTIVDDGVTEDFNTGTNSFDSTNDPLTATATVTFTSTNVDVAVDDQYVFDIKQSTPPSELLLDVLANDVLDFEPTVTALGTASRGTVEIIDDGDNVRYVPNQEFIDNFGSDTFTYTVTDRDGVDSTATVTVTLRERDVEPEAFDDDLSVVANGGQQELDVLANDLVETGQTLEVIAILAEPTNGAASISTDGTRVLYTPDQDFTGTDSLLYEVEDDAGRTETAFVTITVSPSSANPIANDDTVVVSNTDQLIVNVLDNDTLEGNDSIIVEEIVTPPTNGLATISVGGTAIVYEPLGDEALPDSLVYRIRGNNGGTDTAVVTLTVANVDPVANDDTSSGDEDTVQTIDVLDNDTTEDGETLTIDAITVAPANGTAQIVNGNIEYTPDSGFFGSDTLTYSISDGAGGSDTASVAITVVEVELDPIAMDDSITIDSTNETTIDVLANDTGETGETLTITSVSGGQGTVAISSDDSSILYTAVPGATGTDTFTYTIDDGNGRTATATVTVTLDLPVDATSSFAGVVFQDRDSDGQRSLFERGIGGVTVVLEGTDVDGNAVREEAVTDIGGAYRFDEIATGSYSITEMNPAFTIGGTNTFGFTFTEDDRFEFDAPSESIEDATHAERGLAPQFAIAEAFSSWRGDGVVALLEGDDLAWVENRGGWDDAGMVSIDRNGDSLSVQTDNGTADVSLSNQSLVHLIGSSGDHTLIRLMGSNQDILSASSVDSAFAG